MIYFVRPGTDAPFRPHKLALPHVRPIKIGTSAEPLFRLGQLKIIHRRHDFEMLGCIPGGWLTERAHHQQFSDLRIKLSLPSCKRHVEWFKADNRLLAYIEENARPEAEVALTTVSLSFERGDRFLSYLEAAGSLANRTPEVYLRSLLRDHLAENPARAWPFKVVDF